MVVDKIHGVISFRRSIWLEKYITFNTRKRKRAKNDFGKNYLIFRSMENQWNVSGTE